MKKILHIGNDDKFISIGKRIFETISNIQNDFWIISEIETLKHIKFEHTIFTPRISLSKEEINILNSYDLICVHFLYRTLYPILASNEIKTKILWIGWGGDYYWLLDTTKNFNLFLPQTSKTLRWFEKINLLKPIVKRIKKIKRKASVNIVNNIDFFSPVNKFEFDLIIKNYPNFKPQFIEWNYGYIDDSLISYYSSIKRKGNKVMIGNSATPTNNHLDVIYDLEAVLKNESLIFPLSYGDLSYAKKIKPDILATFKNVEFIENFMETQEFNNKLIECKALVIGSMRQQAIGTIITSMYIGVNVFFYKNSINFKYFKDLGLNVFSIEELLQNPSLLNFTISEQIINKNRTIINKNWSQKKNAKTMEQLINSI